MDRMPDAELAFVEKTKVVNYLLARTGRGRAKADFFEAFGFASDRWEDLAEALLDHGKQGSLARSYQTPYGVRYEVEGRLETPSGRRPFLRTVWQEDRFARRSGPRLITAVPSYEGGERR